MILEKKGGGGNINEIKTQNLCKTERDPVTSDGIRQMHKIKPINEQKKRKE
jgi:hypothetical protein